MAAISIHGANQDSGKHVSRIAIVGAGGRSGRSIVEALLKTGKHQITAITRPDSTNVLSKGIHNVVKVDYNDHSALVAALAGQQALIITLAVTAAPDCQIKLIDAAIEAGVRYIVPNQWGIDVDNEQLGKDTLMGGRHMPIREHIEKHGGGKTFWISVCCGFWYEFSLAGTEARYGFDFEKKTVTLYDDGNVKINTSTWPQVGFAMARLFSLKVAPDNEADKTPCLSQYENKPLYISSFFASQRDMFESVLRVTGDKEDMWTVSHENAAERYERGSQMLKEGNMVGFGMLLYVRVFYNDGSGDINAKLDNDALGLPKENFDEATEVAVRMALDGETNSIH